MQQILRIRVESGHVTKSHPGLRRQEIAKHSRSRSLSPKKRKQDVREELPEDVREEELNFETERERKRQRTPLSFSTRSASESGISQSYSDTEALEFKGATQPNEFEKRSNDSFRACMVDSLLSG